MDKSTVLTSTLNTFFGNNKYEGPELPITDCKHDCVLSMIFTKNLSFTEVQDTNQLLLFRLTKIFPISFAVTFVIY